MCGIVSYVGNDMAADKLLKGLETLEYRGYDSAGVAILNHDGVSVVKVVGMVKDLREELKIDGHMGIGHTRWATHGKVTRVNSHPHQSNNKRFTLVHNGVIENSDELKEKYLDGFNFISETDSEVVANLIEKLASDGLDISEIARELFVLLRGSYALSIIDNENHNTLYGIKSKSPLLIGINDKFNMLASDALAMMEYTNQFIEIKDKEFIKLTKNSIEIFDNNLNLVKRDPYTLDIDASGASKGDYEHFMLKEIDEQASVIRRTLKKYVDTDNNINIDDEIIDTFKSCDKIYILAAGTSYHAGLIGKQLFEQLAKIPTEVCVASEFVYNVPILPQKPLFLVISQSGETADCRAALQEIQGLGKIVTITNTVGSTLSREADYTLLLEAGREIAVASTKAYTAQYLVEALLAIKISGSDIDIHKEFTNISNVIEDILSRKDELQEITKNKIVSSRNAFYIGRHVDYYVALEAALKLKEVSYIQCEGFAAGELKHGTIALIEEGTPVIGIITNAKTSLNTRSNLEETKSRGAKIISISTKSLSKSNDDFIFGDIHELFTPIVSVVPTQLIAYYAAYLKGYDVDRPRNLAKSVTVE